MPNLKELTTKIGSGSTPRGGKSAYIDSGIPIIRSQNILDLSFHESGLAFISEEQAQAMEGVSVHLNDVLLNITGDSTARVAIWNRRQQAVSINTSLSSEQIQTSSTLTGLCTGCIPPR